MTPLLFSSLAAYFIITGARSLLFFADITVGEGRWQQGEGDWSITANLGTALVANLLVWYAIRLVQQRMLSPRKED